MNQVPMYSVPNDIKGALYIRPDTNIMTNKKPTVGTLPFYPHTGNIVTPATMKQTTLLNQ